jgi:hypothetical protein
MKNTKGFQMQLEKKEIKPFEEVTIWHRLNIKKKEFEFNHIEEGWSGLEAPLPKSEKQAKKWKGATWKKQYGFLQNGKVIEIGPDGILPLFMEKE